MSGFDNANARLRALKSRLLPRAALEALAQSTSVRQLLLALAATPYRGAIQAVLAQSPPGEERADRAVEALRLDLIGTLGRVRRFFSPNSQAGQLAAAVMRRYDVHNLIAILRGLAHQVPAAEILASTAPIADLGPGELEQLAGAPHLSAAVDLVATWGLPLAQPLLQWRAAPGRALADTSAVELALVRWHLQDALATAQAAGQEGAALTHALRREADTANILTTLRLAGAGQPPPPGAHVFVGSGLVPMALVMAAAARASVPEVVRAWAGTTYGPTLRAALDEYERSHHLSTFERALTRMELRLRARQAIEEALGIGVLLAYTALKTNEVANLRAIAFGVALGEGPEVVRASLLWANDGQA